MRRTRPAIADFEDGRTISQGMRAASRGEEGKEMDSPLDLPERYTTLLIP